MCRYACPVQHPVVQRACGLLCLDSGTDVSSRLVLRAESPDADHRIKHQRSFATGVGVPWARARGAPPSSALCLEHVKEHRGPRTCDRTRASLMPLSLPSVLLS